MNNDSQLEEAIKIVCQFDKVSPSLLQRKLAIGYAEARDLMGKLEEMGIVAHEDGAKPRDVLIKSFKEYEENKDKMLKKIQGSSTALTDALGSVINYNAMVIERTFEAFGIVTKVYEINKRPGETEYCLEVAMGTAVDDILKRDKDIALGTASPTGQVKIVAPIPGRSLIAVLIPTPSKEALEKIVENQEKGNANIKSLTLKQYIARIFYLLADWFKEIGFRLYFP